MEVGEDWVKVVASAFGQVISGLAAIYTIYLQGNS
jgi:hypothetical protein